MMRSTYGKRKVGASSCFRLFLSVLISASLVWPTLPAFADMDSGEGALAVGASIELTGASEETDQGFDEAAPSSQVVVSTGSPTPFGAEGECASTAPETPEVIVAATEWAREADSAYLVVADPDADVAYPLASTQTATLVQVKDATNSLAPALRAYEAEGSPCSEDVMFAIDQAVPTVQADSPAVSAFEAVANQEEEQLYPDIVLVDTGSPLACANIIGAISMLPDDESALDVNGHAGAMCEAILAENPAASIYAVRVADSAGEASLSSVYAGVEYAIGLHPKVISISLTARNADARDVLAPLVELAEQQGIIVVAAVGNEGRDATGTALGGIPQAIVVGACDDRGAKLDSSNWGETVDCYASAPTTSYAAAKVAGIISLYGKEGLAQRYGVFPPAYEPTKEDEALEDAVDATTSFFTAANTAPAVPVYQWVLRDEWGNMSARRRWTLSSAAPSASSIGGQAAYISEGVGWYEPTRSSTPIYEYYWANSRDYLYTTSTNGEGSSYTKIGIAFYADDTKNGPVYRVYYRTADGKNIHLFTPSATTRDYWVSLNSNNRSEGIGFYRLTSYTVAFNGNGSTSGSTASQTLYYGIPANLTANGFKKANHHFTGWATSASGNVAYADKASVSTLNSTDGGTTTLYAKWAIDTYRQTVQVRYQNADGTWGAYSTVVNRDYDYGSTCSWSRAADATYKAASVSYTVTGATTKNVSVYRNSYTTSFDTQGGSAVGSYSRLAGSAFVEPEEPVRDGYVFEGWWTQAQGGVQVNPSTATPLANVVYYAHWAEAVDMPSSGLPYDRGFYEGAAMLLAVSILLAFGWRVTRLVPGG